MESVETDLEKILQIDMEEKNPVDNKNITKSLKNTIEV